MKIFMVLPMLLLLISCTKIVNNEDYFLIAYDLKNTILISDSLHKEILIDNFSDVIMTEYYKYFIYNKYNITVSFEYVQPGNHSYISIFLSQAFIDTNNSSYIKDLEFIINWITYTNGIQIGSAVSTNIIFSKELKEGYYSKKTKSMTQDYIYLLYKMPNELNKYPTNSIFDCSFDIEVKSLKYNIYDHIQKHIPFILLKPEYVRHSGPLL
jgi:hypothetical protein